MVVFGTRKLRRRAAATFVTVAAGSAMAPKGGISQGMGIANEARNGRHHLTDAKGRDRRDCEVHPVPPPKADLNIHRGRTRFEAWLHLKTPWPASLSWWDREASASAKLMLWRSRENATTRPHFQIEQA
jgi:hypothetical protein